MNPNDDLIFKFKDLEWEIPAKGIRQKILRKENQRVRLLEFTDQLSEKEQCTNGHIGYVLEGELSIDFKGKVKRYTKGDGLWINPGSQYARKAVIKKGKKKALLILFEENLD